MLIVENVLVRRGRIPTLENVSLTLEPGKTLAVVGESGAGKSTLIAAVMGLVRLACGRISWCDLPVHQCRPSLVMQEPRAAFNPVLKVRQTILEPIVGKGLPIPHDRLQSLCEKLELPLDLLNRRPAEISIGQAQRAAIIRALISAPALVLFDEPLSALDAVSQKLTAQLIAELQVEHGFAALIVTHDLGYATSFSDEIAVLKSGRVLEIGNPIDFINAPRTEYGASLRDAAIALGGLEHRA
jgi:peptide/nickel transport system ATP-binding protein